MAGRVQRGWTLELAIPLADLGDVAAQPVWGFDVARERKPDPDENSAYTIGGFNDGFFFGSLAFDVTGPVTLVDGKLRNRGEEPVNALVHVLISAPEFGVLFPTWEDRWRDLVSEVIVYQLPGRSSRTAGGLTLLQHDILLKVPDGGRIRFTLLDDKGRTSQWEEFIAHPYGGIEKK